jgi:hypothetical protein
VCPLSECGRDGDTLPCMECSIGLDLVDGQNLPIDKAERFLVRPD